MKFNKNWAKERFYKFNHSGAATDIKLTLFECRSMKEFWETLEEGFGPIRDDVLYGKGKFFSKEEIHKFKEDRILTDYTREVHDILRFLSTPDVFRTFEKLYFQETDKPDLFTRENSRKFYEMAWRPFIKDLHAIGNIEKNWKKYLTNYAKKLNKTKVKVKQIT